jgi:hypothetical protein
VPIGSDVEMLDQGQPAFTLRDVEVWRTSPAARWGGAVVVVGWSAVVAADIIATSGRSGGWVDWVLQTAVAAVLWWVLAMRPSVSLTGDDLVIRNPLWTRRLPLRDVCGAEPGYFGVVIRRDGRRWPLVAWAVQQANAAGALGHSTRASALATRLMSQAEQQG